MNARSLVSIILCALIAGCSGGSSSIAPRKSANTNSTKATVSVHFIWPTRKSNGSARSAQYISVSTNHITITDTDNPPGVAASDLIVRVPFGTSVAQLPAALFITNNYTFKEWKSASETGEPLATGSGNVYVYDPTIQYSVDVVLQPNPLSMGFALTDDGVPGINTQSQTTSSSARIVFCSTNSPFNVYLNPLDGADNVISGPGTPGLTLSSTDSRVSVVRGNNTQTMPPNAGLTEYTVTANSIIASGIGSAYLSVATLLPDGTTNFVQNVNVFTSGC